MAVRITKTRQYVTLVSYLIGVVTTAFSGWFFQVKPRWETLDHADWVELAIVVILQSVLAVRMIANNDWRPPDSSEASETSK